MSQIFCRWDFNVDSNSQKESLEIFLCTIRMLIVTVRMKIGSINVLKFMTLFIPYHKGFIKVWRKKSFFFSCLFSEYLQKPGLGTSLARWQDSKSISKWCTGLQKTPSLAEHFDADHASIIDVKGRQNNCNVLEKRNSKLFSLKLIHRPNDSDIEEKWTLFYPPKQNRRPSPNWRHPSSVQSKPDSMATSATEPGTYTGTPIINQQQQLHQTMGIIETTLATERWQRPVASTSSTN